MGTLVSEETKPGLSLGSKIPMSIVSTGYNNATRTQAGLFIPTGTKVGHYGRSYYMMTLNTYSGALTSYGQYDVYGNGAGAGGKGSLELANDLMSLPTDGSCAMFLWTYDEPRSNRMNNGLPNAIYHCGGSSAVFGSSNFQHRSAYMLIGMPGVGEGNAILEDYKGAVSHDPDAFIRNTLDIYRITRKSREWMLFEHRKAIRHVDSVVTWTVTNPNAGLAVVEVKYPNDPNWHACTSGQPLPNLPIGADLRTMVIYLRVRIEADNIVVAPDISNISITVTGPTATAKVWDGTDYVSASLRVWDPGVGQSVEIDPKTLIT